MGEYFPHSQCTGCPERSAFASSARQIEAREEAIAKRDREKIRISEGALFDRIKKLGRVVNLTFDNQEDERFIRLIETGPDGVRRDELEACPGRYRREVVVIPDPDGEGDITTTEYMCGTRARINGIDTTGWELVTKPKPAVRLDIPRGLDDED